jgi:hypothetical protein
MKRVKAVKEGNGEKQAVGVLVVVVGVASW